MSNSTDNELWSAALTRDHGSRARLVVDSPFDGEPITEVELADERHVERALQEAHALFRNRESWLPAHERVGILERAARTMAKHHAELARLAASEGGKPLIDSQVEVTRAIDTVRLCAEHLRANEGTVVPMQTNAAAAGRFAFTQPEPIGVVVAVSAFNHPLNLIAHQVAPAVAVGCPVIVKPAPVTPLSCLRFIEILHASGLPEAWAQALVIDDNAIAETLVTDPRIGFFSFIGSARVGWMLRFKARPRGALRTRTRRCRSRTGLRRRRS